MAITETRTKLRATLDEINTLKANPDITQADVEKIKLLLQEGKNLKAQLDLLGVANDFASEMAESAGMLKLAGTGGGATQLGMQESGSVTVKSKLGNLLVNDEGDPIIDNNKWKVISDPAYRSAFKAYLRSGREGLKSEHLKVLQEGIDQQGGFLVPDDMLARLISREPTPTTLASKVTTLSTSRDALSVPYVVWTTDDLYTSGMRVTWTGEIPASGTAHRVTEPVFGQIRIPIYTAMMSLPLTNDMVEDSNYPLVNWVTSKFGETVDLLKDNMIINGTGLGQPSGILINSNFIANDVHTGAAAAITWDGLQDLAFALPEQYDDNAAFYFNKTSTGLAIAKLQDGDGRPYWTTGTNDSGLAGQKIRNPILGYPTTFSGFLPNVSAGLYPIIFGDLRGYFLVNRIGFSIQVLRERYAEENQILMLGRVRFGGQLVEDWRVRGQVVSA